MIEVFQVPTGWRWRLICAQGRELVTSGFIYPTQATAHRMAKNLRAKFFSTAALVDSRQGANR